MKSRTCSTCSSGEVWLCAFGNAPDVTSHAIATMRYLYSRTSLNYATLFDLTRVCAQMCEIVYEEKKGYRFLCTSPGDTFSVLMYRLQFKLNTQILISLINFFNIFNKLEEFIATDCRTKRLFLFTCLNHIPGLIMSISP